MVEKKMCCNFIIFLLIFSGATKSVYTEHAVNSLKDSLKGKAFVYSERQKCYIEERVVVAPSKIPTYQLKVEIVGYSLQLLSSIPSSSPTSEEVEQALDLLMKMLLSSDELWLQQINDLNHQFEILQIAVKKCVKRKTGFFTFMQNLNPCDFNNSVAKPTFDDLPLPKQMLKSFWRKCLNCKHIQFGLMQTNLKCAVCNKKFLQNCPVFVNPFE